jgi:maltose/maltodextrin transport system permease protein
MNQKSSHFKWPVASLTTAAGLWLVVRMHMMGEPIWALGVLVLLSAGLYIYLSSNTLAARYLYPGLAAMGVFVLFPMLLTLRLSTTNFSASNLLSFERASAYLLEQTSRDEAKTFDFQVLELNGQWRVALSPESEGDTPAAVTFETAAFAPGAQQVKAQVASAVAGKPLAMRDLIAQRTALQNLSIELPDGAVLRYAGLRQFAVLTPVWKPLDGGALQSTTDGKTYKPNPETGFFEDAEGTRLQPGYSVGVGLKNYAKLIGNEAIRGPFLQIFIWTCMFSALTVFCASTLGMTLAVLLNWDALKGRTVYRTLLFLPYAVPGFISILVFKGLFNQNFGEINMILNALFGIKPSWFADPLLAKIMLLIVNVWLGYAYFMLLCSGLLQSISSDLYEASALAGAGPVTNFFKITVPQVIKPLTPLLISAFAFNFNNFVLIALLTDGRPDFLNTTIPAGTTDILVSYTYRIAFKDAGADFGLAAAISVLIFAMVAVMAIAQLKMSKKGA